MLKGRFIAAVVGLFCLLAIPSSASAMKFATPAGSPITGLPYVSGIVSADFNNDGRDDLATSSSGNPDGISIRLAQSDGTWATGTSVDTGFSSYSLATGDFNNDNKADLVTYRTGGNGTRVFLGNGDVNGTFGSGIPVATPWDGSRVLGSWNALTTGDLNFDGYDDIVFPLSNGDFAVSISDGNGGFSTAASQHVPDAPSAGNDKFSTAAIGDFNDDGDYDIALGMSPSTLDDPSLAAVFVMLGDGAGSFTEAPIHGFHISQPQGFVGKIHSLAVGNFNGTGGDDLAVVTNSDGVTLPSSGTGTVQVFLGDSIFGLTAGSDVFLRESRPGPVLARDFDNDNLTDLAWLERVVPNGPNVDQVVVARGSGNGTFTTSPSTTFEISTSTVSSTDLVSGDFNLDGAWDFATGFGSTTGTIRILRNQIDPVKNRDSIDFGDVVLNSGEKQQGVVIGNAGGPTATVGQVTLTGDDAASFSLPASGCAVQPIAAAFGSCLQGVKFNPVAHRSYSANLHITFSNSSETLDIPLAANVVAPGATFDPDPIDFGQTWVNTSKSRTLEVKSTGDAVLFISGLIHLSGTDAGLYQITSDTCSNRNLAPGDSCFMEVKLNANGVTGAHNSAQLDIANDGYLSPQSVGLSYTGINPGITVNPTSEDFGPVAVGSSEFQTFTVTSSGTTPLEINDVLVTSDAENDFDIVTNNCNGTFAPNATCQFEVEFSPNSGNSVNRSSQVQIGTNAVVETKVVPLTGTALQPDGSLDVGDTIDFGDTTVGTTASRTITVTSNGTAPLHIEEAWVGGPFSADNERFTISNDTCTNSTLAIGQTCSYKVNFTPDQRRDFEAYTSVYNNDGFDETVQMLGNGVQPGASFDAGNYDFGSAPVGTSSNRPKHTFTLNSTGLDPVKVQSLAIEGPDAGSFALADAGVCSAPLPPNENCQVTVSFDPKSGNPGARSAVLSAQTNGGVVEVDLTGTAIPAPTYKAKIAVKYPKKAKVGKKVKLSVKVTNTGTGAISGAKLTYKATQGKSGKAAVAKSVTLPSIGAGKSIRKTITVTLFKSKLKKNGKKSLVQQLVVTRGTTALATARGTTRLDFGQVKSRRPRDVSNS